MFGILNKVPANFLFPGQIIPGSNRNSLKFSIGANPYLEFIDGAGNHWRVKNAKNRLMRIRELSKNK